MTDGRSLTITPGKSAEEERRLAFEYAPKKSTVQRYGGLSGVRNEGLLLSVQAIPRAEFGNQYAHADSYDP